WDFIVLQPGSNESPGYSYPINETLERGRTLIDSIYKFNPCTQVLFYEISYGVWGNSAADLVTYNNTMDLIRPNLEQLADSTESFFAPVGEAFRAKWNNDLNDILWGGYGDIHPNAKGSYIAACTFYSSIFQKQVVNSNITSGIPANEALAIRNHTDTIVLNNLNDWRINTYTPTVNFDMDINDLEITFINNSQNYDSLLWDFNNGSFSSLDSPLHSYNTGGEFNVSLSIFKNGCEYSITQNLTLSSASNYEINKNKDIFFSPNPAKHYIKLHGPLENKIKVVVLNSMGKEVNVTFQKTLDVSRLPEGIYFIQVYSENGEQIFQDKWLKQD
ncbi:MAG: T9SS type A sorting domain-containing protein, partial [Crocinitomicaceae bacterium]